MTTSNYFVLVVTALYAVAAGVELVQGNTAKSVVLGGYVIANVGLMLL